MEHKELLEEVVRKENNFANFTITEIREIPCTKPGDNYLSVVTVVEVEGRHAGGQFSTSMFVKRLPSDASITQNYDVAGAFHNEGVMYSLVLPTLEHLETFPRCYRAQTDLIILEDLKKEGYTMNDRRAGFDFNTAQNIFKALAKYHADTFHSIAIKKSDFLKATELLQSAGFATSTSKDLVETSLQKVIKLIQNSPDLSDVLAALRKLEGQLSETLKTLRKGGKISVLGHGDFWLNNIMIHPKFSDHVRFVDLQACTILSPAVDVWTFLYSSLELANLESSIDSLISVYCKYFIDNITALKLNAELSPTFASLKEDLVSRELYGFIIATIYIQARYITQEDISRFSENKKAQEEASDQLINKMMKARMFDMVRLCKRRGLFTKL